MGHDDGLRDFHFIHRGVVAQYACCSRAGCRPMIHKLAYACSLEKETAAQARGRWPSSLSLTRHLDRHHQASSIGAYCHIGRR